MSTSATAGQGNPHRETMASPLNEFEPVLNAFLGTDNAARAAANQYLLQLRNTRPDTLLLSLLQVRASAVRRAVLHHLSPPPAIKRSPHTPCLNRSRCVEAATRTCASCRRCSSVRACSRTMSTCGAARAPKCKAS